MMKVTKELDAEFLAGLEVFAEDHLLFKGKFSGGDPARYAFLRKRHRFGDVGLMRTCGHPKCVRPDHLTDAPIEEIAEAGCDPDMTYAEVGEKYGISASYVKKLATPLLGGQRKRKRYRIGEELLTPAEIAQAYSLPVTTINTRLSLGERGERLTRPLYSR